MRKRTENSELSFLARVFESGREILAEETRNLASAFDANPMSAAGRRMQAYLRQMGSGAVMIGGSTESRDHHEKENRVRLAFSIMAITGGVQTALMTTTAAVALQNTIGWMTRHREWLQSSMDALITEYRRINEGITQSRKAIEQTEIEAGAARANFEKAREDLAQAQSEMDQTGTDLAQTGRDVVKLENRAIKIVRPDVQSMGDVAASLKRPETVAPDIYVFAGASTETGDMMYDKITMGADGRVVIDRINASQAPADIEKNEDLMYTDMYERVYARTDAAGNAIAMRVEHGINGRMMGEVGSITDDMLAQYLAATGLKITDITADAGQIERMMEKRNEQGDTHIHACESFSDHSQKFVESEANLARVMRELETFRADLAEGLKKGRVNAEKLSLMRAELSRVDEMLERAALFQERLHKGEFEELEDMVAQMPADLRHEFLKVNGMIDMHGEKLDADDTHTALSCPLGGRPADNLMNSAWARQNVTRANTGIAGKLHASGTTGPLAHAAAEEITPHVT